MTQETEILAFRAWRLMLTDDNEPVLRSATHDTIWTGPVLTADVVPTSENTSGVYALAADGDELASYGGVRGTVALSGTVVEGDRGYRAERAVIRSLRILGNDLGDICLLVLAEQLAQRYAVEVTYDPLAAGRSLRSGGAIVGVNSQSCGIVVSAGASNVMISGCSFR